MSTITIPDALTFIIPLIVTLLSNYFRSYKQPAYINALIALGSILLTAITCVWLSGSWTGDPRTLATLVLLYVGYLAKNDFQAITVWLFMTDSPVVAHLARNHTTMVVAPVRASVGPVDQPIVTKPTVVPPANPQDK